MGEKKKKGKGALTRRWSSADTVYAVVSVLSLLVLAVLGNRPTLETVAVFLLLYAVHNYLLYPFFSRKNYKVYIPLAATLILVFFFFCMWSHGNHERRLTPPSDPEPGLFESPSFDRGAPPRHGKGPMGPEISMFLIGVLLVSCNLAGRAWIDSVEREKRYAKMEEEHLNQQLTYLRYQINPHFFMNTLNNIHALVDIDPALAKSSIVEFSRLMRYLLYEGDKPTIPLDKEAECIEHYIALMRLRFSDNVEISFNVSGVKADTEVPPLLFVTFVENAFKHGISYESDSFIKISIRNEASRVLFSCINSRASTPLDSAHGIGLQNIRNRLDLLYGEDYDLSIESSGKEYSIRLDIPSKCKFLETT